MTTTYTDDQWKAKIAAGTLAGRQKALRASKAHAFNEARNIARKAKRRLSWSSSVRRADTEMATTTAMGAAINMASEDATRRTLLDLERLNERAHALHVCRQEKLKRSYITL
jgi:hypothetical protein